MTIAHQDITISHQLDAKVRYILYTSYYLDVGFVGNDCVKETRDYGNHISRFLTFYSVVSYK